MGLKLTLKPNERIVVNGCVIRNSGKRHVITIDNRADVVRGEDLLPDTAPAAPVRQAYFLIQTALISPETREKIVPVIQDMLVRITGIYSRDKTAGVFEAANQIAQKDYYKAMSALRPLMRHESAVMDYVAQRQAEAEAAIMAPAEPDVRAAG